MFLGLSENSLCNTSASTLLKVHLLDGVVCSANNSACAILMDTERQVELPSALNGKQRSLT